MLTLPAPAPRPGPLLMGVRPEHADLDAGGNWPLKVELMEMLGAERLIHGHLGGVLFTLRIESTVPPPRVGDTVMLGAEPARVHWFDTATGKRVESL